MHIRSFITVKASTGIGVGVIRDGGLHSSNTGCGGELPGPSHGILSWLDI